VVTVYSQTKIRILEEVLEPKRFTDLLNNIGISKKNLGIHLNKLEEMGLIVKGQDGKYVLTDKGKEILETLQQTEALKKAAQLLADEDVIREDFVEIKRSMAPSKTFLTAVAPKGLVTPLVKIPFIQDVIVNLKPEEKRFYEFLSKLYLESLKIYGPPTLEFDSQLFRHVRKTVIRKAVPEISEDEINSFRFQFLVVFNPSYAFDKIVGEIEDPNLRDELMKFKKQILKDFLEKLYGIKVVERKQ
jgi:DNA-binding HxlR family transcriptional regulator